MSGTKGMLPTVFDVEPVSKADKIHQAEKPVELLEEIIGFITMPNEKILDQYLRLLLQLHQTPYIDLKFFH